MILESLGVEKYLEEHMNSTNYLLGVMKYKGPQTSDTKVGLTTHSDKNIVTILYQNEVEGLEVMTKDGKWISYRPSPDSFVVMIGDSLHVNSIHHLHLKQHKSEITVSITFKIILARVNKLILYNNLLLDDSVNLVHRSFAVKMIIIES